MTSYEVFHIRDLCKKHTTLSSNDIAIIENITRNIDVTADLMGADIFIDCLTRDPDIALVLAQARPSNKKSLYAESVIGEYAHRSNEPAVLRTLHIGKSTSDMLARTQEFRNVRQNVSAICNDKKEIIACLIAESDVTNDIKAKRNLSLLSQTTEQLTEALLSQKNHEADIPQHITEGIIVFNHLGLVLYANPVAQQIYNKLGYMNDLEGLSFANMALEDIDFDDILNNRHKISSDVHYGGMELVLKYVRVQKSLPNQASVVVLMQDETDIKEKEKELVLKSVAIQEIHHRVKNNLQMVAGLLRLQSRRVENKDAKEAFNKSISRIMSIAATHDILAQENVDTLDLNLILKQVSNDIVSYSQAKDKNIQLLYSGDSILVSSDIATSIALVVCEVLQNCFKHAFVGLNKGNIRIQTNKGHHFSHISITDDGIGFNSKEKSTHLGNQIIQQIISDKLHGTYTIESCAKGTTVFFDFSMENEGYKETIYSK